MTKPTCFVIQPFDNGGFFDDLYDLVYERAIIEANFKPTRADKVLGAKPPLTKIEEELNKSAVCIADVTIDNPNVFLEIGWAIGLSKHYFILWDKAQRERLPFDIAHSAGIPYDSSEKGWQKKLIDALKQNLIAEKENTPTAEALKESDTIILVNKKLTQTDRNILDCLLDLEANGIRPPAVNFNNIIKQRTGDKGDQVVLSVAHLKQLGFVNQTISSYSSESKYYLTNEGKDFLGNERLFAAS